MGKRKTYTVAEQISYHGKKSKKGAKDNSGNPLSDFRRGEHLGKAKGLISGAKIANMKKRKKEIKPSDKKNRVAPQKVHIDKSGTPYVKGANGKRDYDPYSVLSADREQTLRDIGSYDI